MERKANDNDSVSMKEYVDARISDLKDMLSEGNRLAEKAIDQYSKTTDEWKTLHNGLQRKNDDDRNMFVRKEDADKQSKLNMQRTIVIIMVVSIVVGAIYQLMNFLTKK
jgi:hypothetical protein